MSNGEKEYDRGDQIERVLRDTRSQNIEDGSCFRLRRVTVERTREIWRTFGRIGRREYVRGPCQNSEYEQPDNEIQMTPFSSRDHEMDCGQEWLDVPA